MESSLTIVKKITVTLIITVKYVQNSLEIEIRICTLHPCVFAVITHEQ